MENGVKIATTEGSPQGAPLSPRLANVYLNEFDWEYERRGVPVIRYADDIVLLCKSRREAERLLESSIRYLEGEGWAVHSCSSKSLAESEEQAARNHEAKPRSQCPKGHAGKKST